MCSLHLTHPRAHTLRAVGTVHSAADENNYFANKHLNKYISIKINYLQSLQAIAV